MKTKLPRKKKKEIKKAVVAISNKVRNNLEKVIPKRLLSHTKGTPVGELAYRNWINKSKL